MAHHLLAARGAALHGHFDRDRPPALTVAPGDTVELETLDAWWSAERYPAGGLPEDRRRVGEHYADAGHALTGPILIEGARAGTTLAVDVQSVVPGEWGTTIAGGRPTPHNVRYGIEDELAVLSWDLDAAAMTGRNQLGHTVALRPFLGVMGVAPAGFGPHSTIPPRAVGGNLDCKELVAGSTLYLPIAVDGALFSAGDGHARQGDGEVGGTAIECPTRARLRFELRDDLPIATPLAETPAGWVTMGVADSVDAAVVIALNAMYDLIQRRHGLRRADAVALASVVVDTRVTQIVNEAFGAHAVLPRDVLR